MNKRLVYFMLSLLGVILLPVVAHAAPDIAPFEKLAEYAGRVGCGLRKVGIVIAGFGLIVVTMGAIFGKVNWKTLSYIMLGCMVLAGMAAVAGLATRGGEGTEGNINRYCADTLTGSSIGTYAGTADPTTTTPPATSKTE